MARTLIDLARPLENTVHADPPGLAPEITYLDHQITRERMLQFFPGVTEDQLPGREAWAVETVTISTHNGTHLDAPYHFHSTMDGGQRAITIDEVPLARFSRDDGRLCGDSGGCCGGISPDRA